MNRQMTASEVAQMSVLHPEIARSKRDDRIRALRKNGMTLQAIADEVGLTRARVQQICKTTNPEESP